MEKIKDCFEAETFFLKRIRKKDFDNKIKIENSSHAKSIFLKHTNWKDSIDIIESFYVMGLRRNNTVVFIKRVSLGGISSTLVDIRLVVRLSLYGLCSSLIIAHNHPSGNLKPSTSDRKLTDQLTEALKLFDINLLDHLIIGRDEKYTSFADENLLIC